MPADQEELDRYFAWRDAMRRKHRTMTMGEYRAWLQGGDLISHPSKASNFLGGLTILLDTPAIIGKVEGYEPPPTMTDSISSDH
jgi:hypothetical protein